MRQLLQISILCAVLGFNLSASADSLSFLTNTQLSAGTSTTTTLDQLFTAGEAAAVGWSTWANNPGTITTELLNSTFPGGTGTMLHVAAEGARSGLFQYWGGSAPAGNASVWIYVVSGQAGLGIGVGRDTTVSTYSTGTGHWELLQATNSAGPISELIIYSSLVGGADFYVYQPWAGSGEIRTFQSQSDPPSAVPEPATLALVGSGLVSAGISRRRFRKKKAGTIA